MRQQLLFFFAGRIANPPWGAPLRSRIRNPAGFTMPAPILKRTSECSQSKEGAFQFRGSFIFCRADCESALGSSASEPDSQSGGFYNACPYFETHPLITHLAFPPWMVYNAPTPGVGCRGFSCLLHSNSIQCPHTRRRLPGIFVPSTGR